MVSVKERAKIRAKLLNLKSERIRVRIQKDTTLRIRKLKRMPDETIELSLINWQKRQKRQPKIVIWVRSTRLPEDCAEYVKNVRQS